MGFKCQGISEPLGWSDITAPVNKARHFIPLVFLLGTVVVTQCEQGFFFFKLLVLLPNSMPIKRQFPSFDEKFLSVIITY